MTRSASWLAPLVAGLVLNGCADDNGQPPGAVATPTSSLVSSFTATSAPSATRTLPPTPSPSAPPLPPPTPTSTQLPLPATPPATPTLTSTPPEETPEPSPTSSGCCGDGAVDAGEECDDGNQVGGDDCAANCTVEQPFALEVVGRATIQAASFALPIDITSRQTFRLGQATLAEARRSCAGGPQFAVGEIPLAQRSADLAFDPAPVPGLICACVRAVEIRRCGVPLVRKSGSDCSVGDDCSFDASLCGDTAECRSAHGEGNASSGVIGCAGLDDVDYDVHADGVAGTTVCTRHGGSAPSGSAFIYATTMIGTIMDSGTCSEDTGNEAKGPDGIPCTGDDPAVSRGMAMTSPLTTGTAGGGISYGGSKPPIAADSVCGASPCTTSARGEPFSCDLFPGAPRLCAALNAPAQPMVGDVVITICYEPRPPSALWEDSQRN